MATLLAGQQRRSLSRKVFGELGLLSLSSMLFALAFPSFLSDKGWWPLAFIALAPAVPVLRSCSWKLSPLYGAFYGFFSYALFNYWLTTFHPLAIFIVPVIYAVYYALLFPLLKFFDNLFPRYSYLMMAVLWLAYEFLRTQGFLGYSYGIIGYTLYAQPVLIQISGIFGVWGVSFFLALINFFLGDGLAIFLSEDKPFSTFIHSWGVSRRRDLVSLLAMVLAVVLFGLFSMRASYDDVEKVKLALVQHNADTWEGGLATYRRNFELMRELSEKAIEEADPDMVIWSETAFVPGLDWHSRYRTDPARYELVEDLVSYLETKEIPFVFGNDDGQIDDESLPPVLSDGSYNRVDYNAVIHFEDGAIQNSYRKTHLVPFTENFPYEHIFPRFYQLLVDHDYHFWERGTEYTVFETASGLRFSTPICFEDIFGYLSRRFVREGADMIINLTNDSWSGSVPSQMQHMAMAVFRAVELKRTVVRSSNSGMTCVIDPDGRIETMLEPFTADYLIEDAPIYTEKTTLYYHLGDWFAWLMLATSLITLFYGIVRILVLRFRA